MVKGRESDQMSEFALSKWIRRLGWAVARKLPPMSQPTRVGDVNVGVLSWTCRSSKKDG
jgi:hypothetical protein